MRFLCLIAVLAVVFPSAARAQASRDVLLNVCNDTGLVAAAAAAYRTGPGDGRTLRSWFLIEPGTCLGGALNNVAGDSLDLHVMSGSFHWPGDGGQAYCVPAGSTFAVASQPPCSNGSQERAFVSLPIEASGHRDRLRRSVGQVAYRFSCTDLAADDVSLCQSAMRDDQGMAQPVRELEVCNSGRRAVRVAALETGQHLTAVPMTDLDSGECQLVYRGYPADYQLRVLGSSMLDEEADGSVCLDIADDGRINEVQEMSGRRCPAEARDRFYYRIAVFGPYTDRHTTFVGR